jgi:hypothetical protein
MEGSQSSLEQNKETCLRLWMLMLATVVPLCRRRRAAWPSDDGTETKSSGWFGEEEGLSAGCRYGRRSRVRVGGGGGGGRGSADGKTAAKNPSSRPCSPSLNYVGLVTQGPTMDLVGRSDFRLD